MRHGFSNSPQLIFMSHLVLAHRPFSWQQLLGPAVIITNTNKRIFPGHVTQTNIDSNVASLKGGIILVDCVAEFLHKSVIYISN